MASPRARSATCAARALLRPAALATLASVAFALVLHPTTANAQSSLPEAPVAQQLTLAAEPGSAAAELTPRPSSSDTLDAPAQAQPEASSDNEQTTSEGFNLTGTTHRLDGVSAEESFTGTEVGSGVEEDTESADVPREASAGPGFGSRSVESGGRRAGAAYVFSQAAVREFHVDGLGDAAAYGSAVYGHGIGGVITNVSRSGEQRVHGMAFYNVRSSAWASADPFSIASTYSNGVVSSGVVKPSDLRQQFGGRIGGPISSLLPEKITDRYTLNKRYINAAHDGPTVGVPNRGIHAAGRGDPRLFYLYAFDAQRRSFPAVSSPGNPEFYRLTAMQTALLANRGVSATQTNAALNYLESLTGVVDRSADQAVNFGRVDWARTANERLIVEYNRARWSNPAGARTAAVVNRGRASLGSSYGAVDMGVARWVRFVTPRVTHELRVQYGRELQYEVGQAPLAQEPAVGPGGLPPEVAIGPEGMVFGTPAGLGRKAYPEENRLEAAEVASWTSGLNLLQIGADVSLIREHTDSLTNSEGTFSYDSGYTNGRAGGLVDWITDYTYNVHANPSGACPSVHATLHYSCFRSYSQSFGAQSVRFAQQEWAGFVQDDWSATSTLTVHAGVRYDYGFLPLPQHPNAALDTVFGAQGASSVYPEDRNNFGPRVGLEWWPRGGSRTTLRLGYGVYFGRVPGAMLQEALLDTAAVSGVSRIRIIPTTTTLCPQAAGVGFGYACSYLTVPAGAVASTTSAVVFDRGFRLPMVQQGTVSVEHEVGRGVVLRGTYVTNVDRQLPGSTDINIAPAVTERMFALTGVSGRAGMQEGETFAVPAYTARVSPSFGSVTDIVSRANATYEGMTLEARRGLGGMRDGRGRGARPGLAYSVRWTWSKALDFAPNTTARPRADGQFDPFDVRYDKGISALNQPHRFTGTLVWSPGSDDVLPGVAERKAVRWVMERWSVAGMFEEASGRPFSYEIFGGTRLSGGRETINGSGGSTVLPTLGRNTLMLPDTMQFDARLMREFQMGAARIAFSAQAFNVINHTNVTGVQQRAFLVGTAVNGVTPLVFQDAAAVAAEGLNAEPFGTYTAAARRQRQVELDLKLMF